MTGSRKNAAGFITAVLSIRKSFRPVTVSISRNQ